MVKNLPAMQGTWVRSLGWEDPLERGRAAYRGDPRTETELDRVLESSPLALGETFSTLVTLPYVEELTLTGCANGLPCSLIPTGLGPVG